MPRNGYLAIADISGYSEYLHKSELDHARDSLNDLLNVLVEHTRSPLRIVELEGDAVFSYAPAEEVQTANTLADMVEDAYVAFRRALNLMVINTTCTCKACRLLPTLDLKFFIHYGAYMRQDVAEHQKLVGNDVNVVHRLLKNDVEEATGFEAYAAYTEPAVEHLRLDREVEGLVSHAETYDDVGEVEMCVKDMHGVWEAARDKLRVRVSEEEALEVFEARFPLPPEEIWHYSANPATRNMMMSSDWQRLEPRPDGGIGPGATYVCAHGNRKHLQTIVDWEPPYTYTIRGAHPTPDTTALVTFQLIPEGSGSRVRLLLGPTEGPRLYRVLWDLLAPRWMRKDFEKGMHVLEQLVQQDLDESHGDRSGDSEG